jgi:EmrB/QacA subfamily drug resistance transporter
LQERQTFTSDERRITLIAVMIVFSLSALDQTIVSTAMPRIVAELKGLNLYAWVTTGYLLTSTVMVPIWGKLSDSHGRKRILLAGIAIFLVGSWLSGLSTSMVQLIVFRAIQGIGGGALFTTAFAIIADLFEPRERSRFGGLFGSVFGLASLIGPVVGGFFTEHGTIHLFGQTLAGWRWVFYLNLPLSALALFMIIVKMPKLAHSDGAPIDYFGAGLIVLTFAPLLLALSWGGQTYPWGSPIIVGLLAFAAIALAGFLYIETKVREPIMPLELFADRTFATCNSAAFIVSMAFMGVVTFLPLFMQVGLGTPATASGLAMVPMMVGMIGSSTACGLLVSRTGAYKPFMLGGGVMLAFAVFLMTFIGPNTSLLGLGWRMFIVGLGLGPSQSLFSLAVQNAVPPHRMGVATSSGMFFRQIGQTVGVAVFGALLTHNLNAELVRRAPVGPAGGHQTIDVAQLQAMALSRAAAGAQASADLRSPAMIRAVSESFAVAMVHLFDVALLGLGAAIVIILLIPVVPMRARMEAAKPLES